jgi:hypothetical protein
MGIARCLFLSGKIPLFEVRPFCQVDPQHELNTAYIVSSRAEEQEEQDRNRLAL